ncbi:TetR/AcrR family transcriptional regulator [Streptodolium elevatio]
MIARRGVRGLRVDELAAEAGVSIGLVYYHFGNRAGLMQRTWEFINERAEQYTKSAIDPAVDPRGHLEEMLLRELQDEPDVVENSTAWGEYRASAVFDAELGRQLREATAGWVRDADDLIRAGQKTGDIDPHVVPADAAERLTALVEGISERWVSGSLPLARARALLRSAIALELGADRRTVQAGSEARSPAARARPHDGVTPQPPRR